MLFKSALLTQASGSVGGITFSRNRGGMYIRSRAIPTDPSTLFQREVRDAMNAVVARWSSSLTVDERDDWNVYASLVTLPGPLGDPITVSGFNMFVRTNVARIQSGVPFAFDAPTLFNIGETGEVSFAATAVANEITVAFDDTQAWANIDDGALLLFVSRPQNATINFFKGPFRAMAPVEGLTVGPPVSPAVITSPFNMTADQRVWLKVSATTPDGRLSASSILGPVTVV